MEKGKRHRYDFLVEWFEEYLIEKNYPPRTIKDNISELTLFRSWLEQQPEIHDIDNLETEHIESFTNSLYIQNLVVAIVGHKLAVIKKFLTVLYDENKLKRNFAAAFNLPDTAKSFEKYLTEEEVNQVFRHLEEQTSFKTVKSKIHAVALRDRAAIELLYSCALRPGELFSLTLKNIEYDNAMLFIWDEEGNLDRLIPVGITALKAVKRYMAARSFLLTAENCHSLFLCKKGKGLSVDSFRYSLKKTLAKAGVEKKIRIQDIRHSRAVHMVNSGSDIRYLNKFLGHAALSSTKRYRRQ